MESHLRSEAVSGIQGVDDLGPGSPDDVPRRYRDATLTLLPSVGEAFGLVLVESLASGTPVVCSADGGMPEIVSDPRIGRTAPPYDLDGLARAVEEVIELSADPETAARCTEHARRWDWSDSVGPAHLELYQRVAAGPRRSSRRGPAPPNPSAGLEDAVGG